MSRVNEQPRMVTSGALGRSPRAFNMALGAWLVISAFAWPHPRWQFFNTAIPGMAIVVVALVACMAPWVRYLNTAISAYLFVAAWCCPANTSAEIATQGNNLIIGLWVFLISVLHDGPADSDSSAPHRSGMSG